ncbi:MAG: hypothetical protein IJ572_02370 [Bacilli bacterium]|nr:hypothetical protein [Bacilli bacterium]
MEYLIEFVLELILEGTTNLSLSRRVPKFIRYPLAIILILLFASIIVLLFLVGVLVFKDNIYYAILIIIVAIILLVSAIVRFIKIYKHKFKVD